jgi:hypothetical protein
MVAVAVAQALLGLIAQAQPQILCYLKNLLEYLRDNLVYQCSEQRLVRYCSLPSLLYDFHRLFLEASRRSRMSWWLQPMSRCASSSVGIVLFATRMDAIFLSEKQQGA